MKFDNVNAVAIVNEEMANKMLQHGWKLLKVAVEHNTDDRYLPKVTQISTTVFVLGASSKVAKHYPRSQAENDVENDGYEKPFEF